LAPHEIAYILDHAASKVVFYHADFAPVVEELAPRLRTKPTFVVLEGEPGGLADHEYEALLASGSPEPRHPEIDENAVAELFYTSGTTGLPKGVAMTHRELYLHSLSAQIGLAFTEDDWRELMPDEEFTLKVSRTGVRLPEDDLFAGLRGTVTE
jgi:fatty-acyl-CoA synthase